MFQIGFRGLGSKNFGSIESGITGSGYGYQTVRSHFHGWQTEHVLCNVTRQGILFSLGQRSQQSRGIANSIGLFGNTETTGHEFLESRAFYRIQLAEKGTDTDGSGIRHVIKEI
jgi:hypothetical protein